MRKFPEGCTPFTMGQFLHVAQYRLEIGGNRESGWLSWTDMQTLVSRRFPHAKVKIHYGPWHMAYAFGTEEMYRAVLDGFEQVACICAQPLPPAPQPTDAALQCFDMYKCAA